MLATPYFWYGSSPPQDVAARPHSVNQKTTVMKSPNSKGLVAVSALALAVIAAITVYFTTEPANAHTKHAPGASAAATPFPGLSRQPTAAARAALLDPSDTVVLLIDHQTGLFQTVKDVPV